LKAYLPTEQKARGGKTGGGTVGGEGTRGKTGQNTGGREIKLTKKIFKEGRGHERHCPRKREVLCLH